MKVLPIETAKVCMSITIGTSVHSAHHYPVTRNGKRISMSSQLAFCISLNAYLSLQVSPVHTDIVIFLSTVYTDTL